MKFSHLKEIQNNNSGPIDMTILEMARPKKVQPSVTDTEDASDSKPEKIPHFTPTHSASDEASESQTVELFESIFRTMKNKRDFKQFAGVLLSGDPGTGKTQRINLLSKILGVSLVTVEAPHIVEEHIINIPFIVFDSETGKEKGGSTTLKGDLYRVVLADSNLYTALKNVDIVPDVQHLKNIYKSSKEVIATYEALGGTPTELPENISELRKQFKVILFLDEYFRQTSPRIKNMLRGILNGKIGNHDIPSNAYVIYATNLHDEGIGEIQKNFQFKNIKMDAPSKDEWFTWLVNKFENDKHVKLKPELIDRFHHILDDEDISKNDVASDVRTSPRRWEQLLLYINAALPVKDREDAVSLLTNVKTNFRNYLSNEHSKELADKVLKATAQLIKETSNGQIEVSHTSQNSASDWRSTLKQQIETKMKLGDLRKYVPIIAGLPGIGKTAQADKLAKDLDLRFIDIDCSTISPEDVSGLPLPTKGENGESELETTFSMPGLYQLLMQKIKEEDNKYLEVLKKKDPDNFEENKKAYENREYKYLIFFDELNRNSTKVFNGIRRVLLEKNFGPAGKGKTGKLLELPSSAIMLGAINPDDAGASELTKHMQDVLDIMDAKSSWKDTLSYLTHASNVVPGENEATHNLALDIIKLLVSKYETKRPEISTDHRPFFWDIGQEVYVSPREYTQLFIELVRAIGEKLKKILKLDLNGLTKNELTKLENKVRKTIFNALEENTSFILFKHDSDGQVFYQELEAWVMHSDEIDLGENFFYDKAVNTKTMSLKEIVGHNLKQDSDILAHENDNFVAFLQNADVQKLREDLFDIVNDHLKDITPDEVEKMFEKKYPILRLSIKGKQMTAKDAADHKTPTGVIKDSSVKTSLFENFTRQMIFSLYIHSISYDRMLPVRKAITSACSTLSRKITDPDFDFPKDVASVLMDEIGEIISPLHELVDIYAHYEGLPADFPKEA